MKHYYGEIRISFTYTCKDEEELYEYIEECCNHDGLQVHTIDITDEEEEPYIPEGDYD